MTKAIATMVGILLLSHGGLGLFIEGEHLLGLFNVDIALDLTYLTLGLLLVLVGETEVSAGLTRGVVALGALVMGGIGLVGLLDRHLLGLAPTGFELLDFLVFFGIAGSLGLAVLQSRSGAIMGEAHTGAVVRA